MPIDTIVRLYISVTPSDELSAATERGANSQFAEAQERPEQEHCITTTEERNPLKKCAVIGTRTSRGRTNPVCGSD